MATVINMPKLSPTMEEGVLAKWTKKVGDKIALSVTRGTEKKEFAVALQEGGFERMRGRRPEGHTPRPYAASMGGNRDNVQDEQGPDGYQTGANHHDEKPGATKHDRNLARQGRFGQLQFDSRRGSF